MATEQPSKHMGCSSWFQRNYVSLSAIIVLGFITSFAVSKGLSEGIIAAGISAVVAVITAYHGGKTKGATA